MSLAGDPTRICAAITRLSCSDFKAWHLRGSALQHKAPALRASLDFTPGFGTLSSCDRFFSHCCWFWRKVHEQKKQQLAIQATPKRDSAFQPKAHVVQTWSQCRGGGGLCLLGGSSFPFARLNGQCRFGQRPSARPSRFKRLE